jgi:hypothetical protein
MVNDPALLAVNLGASTANDHLPGIHADTGHSARGETRSRKTNQAEARGCQKDANEEDECR